MRRTRTRLTCLAIIAALPCVAQADVIQGTVSLSVGSLYGTTSLADDSDPTTLIEGPTQFSGALAAQNGKWYATELSGPNLGQGSPLLPSVSSPAQVYDLAPFRMTITLDGASGVNPTITLGGILRGNFSSEPLEPGTAVPGLSSNVVSAIGGIPTSVSVQGWTPSSGIPQSVINQLSNLSNYSIFQEAYDVNSPTMPEFGFELSFGSGIEAEAPEPSTILLYLGAIAGLGAGRVARLRRFKSQP